MDGWTDTQTDIYDLRLSTFPLPAPTAEMFPPTFAPVLLPPVEEMVVDLHTPFTLTCRGSGKLAWESPLDVMARSQEDNSGLFATTITVDAATAMHTGYYRCYYSTNTTEDIKYSSIYVYVPGRRCILL